MDLKIVLIINFKLKKAKKLLNFLQINKIESWKIAKLIKLKINNL
jgi:hypothetical protein